uniref:Eukaryotic translation initiation factor 4E binding protein 2 n=1 Tax=Felis catus TaxID=9685 RepID=A0ABI7YXI2_FELCA
MSSSSGSGHQPSQSRAIPTRTVPISDAAQLPHDYCTTPGGTLFSTTPGGTRIIYDRKFLLDRRNSPMAQTPPCHLPNIPGVTSPGTLIEDSKVEVNNLNNLNNHDRKQAVVLSILRETTKESRRVVEGQRKRERENPSELRAVSDQPDSGLDPTNRDDAQFEMDI